MGAAVAPEAHVQRTGRYGLLPPPWTVFVAPGAGSRLGRGSRHLGWPRARCWGSFAMRQWNGAARPVLIASGDSVPPLEQDHLPSGVSVLLGGPGHRCMTVAPSFPLFVWPEDNGDLHHIKHLGSDNRGSPPGEPLCKRWELTAMGRGDPKQHKLPFVKSHTLTSVDTDMIMAEDATRGQALGHHRQTYGPFWQNCALGSRALIHGLTS
ncbi:hypothetical protein NDU88_001890 [Pleurodeles waltl]|uniref:Uncharacterized protein n=1 Tax=Pleurodeles waltl TaxID=8319 RepID=A0AAV7MPS2_PLEWA|nr:hypothetical protein NDU88_001890 [Pleurodeles waltl]